MSEPADIACANPVSPLRSRGWWTVPILVWLLLVGASALWNHHASRRHAFDVATFRSRYDTLCELLATQEMNP